MTTTDNTEVILRLEREVDLWKKMYRTVQYLHDVETNSRKALENQLISVKDKYRTEQSLRAQADRGRIEAQTQLEHIRRGADMYGVMQGMALQGKTHPKEPPMDGRLEAIRSLVAHNAKLVAELADMQRLHARAIRKAMEAESRADGHFAELALLNSPEPNQ